MAAKLNGSHEKIKKDKCSQNQFKNQPNKNLLSASRSHLGALSKHLTLTSQLWAESGRAQAPENYRNVNRICSKL